MTAPRRWFRFAFSLRSMFVLVTVCALWLGWQVRIVQERKAVLAEVQRVDEDASENAVVIECGFPPEVYGHSQVSLVRRLLGDESHLEIWLPRSMGLEWIARAEVAFPEARLYHADGPFDDDYDFRDSLYKPNRKPNRGTLFKTGIPDPYAADSNSPQNEPAESLSGLAPPR